VGYMPTIADDHVTPLLNDLLWLRVQERIVFLLAVGLLVYRCQHGIAPPYLANELHRVAGVEQCYFSCNLSVTVSVKVVHSQTFQLQFKLLISVI